MSQHDLNDLNIVAAGLLEDLALLQPSERSRFGYTRAAKAIRSGIDRSVADLVAEGRLRDVPFVGPSSERVIVELVRTGRSATVDNAVAASASVAIDSTPSLHVECICRSPRYARLDAIAGGSAASSAARIV